jgi:peroxiredoxin Q/BCP
MANLITGDLAPDFTLPTDGGGEITLSHFRGKNVILYFYPKDDTPGCTAESCAFNEALPQLNHLGAVVIGISKCTVTMHDKFKKKYGLNFPLASDENSDVCERYGVWTEKSMYGKTYMGIERTTFLINEQGRITHMWSKVKVPGHVESVQAALAA